MTGRVEDYSLLSMVAGWVNCSVVIIITNIIVNSAFTTLNILVMYMA